jgi:uncharacterized protein YukE
MMNGPFEVAPGNPDDLRAAARTFRLLAQQHDAVRSSFIQVTSETSDGWSGRFADRFRQSATEIADRFKPVCEAAMDMALALTSYATALEEAQQSVTNLNSLSSQPAYTHSDPVVRALAMGQLRVQADATAEQLDAAATAFVSRISWSQDALESSLPDITSATELMADIQRASDDLKKESPGTWETIFGPEGFLRTWDERLHSPTDLLALDLVITRFIDTAEFGKSLDSEALKQAEAWAKSYPELLTSAYQEDFGNVIQRLREGEVAEPELAQELRDFTADNDMLRSWGTGTLQDAKAAIKADGFRLTGGELLGGTLDVMAVAGDAYTLWQPEDSGAGGWVDRTAAAGNIGAAGLDLAELGGFEFAGAIPGVGEVVGVGTGLYLGGDWLYHHWTPFHNVVDDTGHLGVSIAKGIWHGITSVL